MLTLVRPSKCTNQIAAKTSAELHASEIHPRAHIDVDLPTGKRRTPKRTNDSPEDIGEHQCTMVINYAKHCHRQAQ